MGHGIAQVTASRGFETRLYDIKRAVADKGFAQVRDALSRLVDKGKLEAPARDRAVALLSVTDDLRAAVAGAEVVIEAVPEQMDLKVELFRAARDGAPRTALLASNTSSLSITELGRRIESPERVVGLHFFNPPPVMELIEVVQGVDTSAATIERALALVAALQKTPIVVRDFPGFATSRLGVALGAEAIRMVEQRVASVASIDRAMELGYRHPMGPLKLGDLVGLDVRLGILEHLHRELGEVFRPPALLRQMVRAGRLGKKTGIGFYRWTDRGAEPVDP